MVDCGITTHHGGYVEQVRDASEGTRERERVFRVLVSLTLTGQVLEAERAPDGLWIRSDIAIWHPYVSLPVSEVVDRSTALSLPAGTPVTFQVGLSAPVTALMLAVYNLRARFAESSPHYRDTKAVREDQLSGTDYDPELRNQTDRATSTSERAPPTNKVSIPG